MSVVDKDYFQRNRLLLGDKAMSEISRKKVIIFGLGGVGSWCAESLVRSGIENITIVDFDTICATNINRQIMATSKTIGESKAYALKKRLLEINPDATIIEVKQIYNEKTKDDFNLSQYDYIIDCIDSLKDKILLIVEATKIDTTLFSSMGSALKKDISRIKIAEFWKVEGCPLAAIMRKHMRRTNLLPSKKFRCVYSPEVSDNLGMKIETLSQSTIQKAQINGSMVHITATFGLILTGLVIEDIITQL